MKAPTQIIYKGQKITHSSIWGWQFYKGPYLYGCFKNLSEAKEKVNQIQKPTNQ